MTPYYAERRAPLSRVMPKQQRRLTQMTGYHNSALAAGCTSPKKGKQFYTKRNDT